MLAAVDIGSLTARLLIGEVKAGRVLPRHYRKDITRLGSGLHQDKGLLPEARERTLSVLTGFAADIRRRRVSGLSVVGTEALRQASNAASFVAEVRACCGMQVDIIDGQREAQLTALGVLAALRPRPECCLAVDIGGGSTEFALLSGGQLLWRLSLPLGVVRLAGIAADGQVATIAALLGRAGEVLAAAGFLETVLAPQCQLVGTAGTVTTLTAMALQMHRYDWRLINNQVLSLKSVGALKQLLSRIGPDELRGIPGLEPGREEFVGPGLAILEKLLEVFGKTSLRVSDFGVLEGLLVELGRHRSD